jgi:hypothetical protein
MVGFIPIMPLRMIGVLEIRCLFVIMKIIVWNFFSLIRRILPSLFTIIRYHTIMQWMYHHRCRCLPIQRRLQLLLQLLYYSNHVIFIFCPEDGYGIIPFLDGYVGIFNHVNELIHVVNITNMVGLDGFLNPHDAHFIPGTSGDFIFITWNPGRIGYFRNVTSYTATTF